MQVTLARDYRCSPNGHTTFAYKAGEVVTGRVAELALRDGAAVMPRPPVLDEPKVRKPRITKPKTMSEAK